MRYTGIWEDQRQAQGQGEEGKISLSPLFVIPLSSGAGGVVWPAPSPHHDNLSACSSQIYILLNKRHIFLLFISPQILYLCYCHVRARSSPSLPSGASHRVCCRNHLICRLWSARSRDDPSQREQKSPRWGMTSLIESGTPPWRSALSRQTAAASWRCRFFTSKRNNLCGEKCFKIFEHIDIRRAPPTSFSCLYQILDFNSRALCLRVEAFDWVSSGIWRRESERKLRKLESSERIIARL